MKSAGFLLIVALAAFAADFSTNSLWLTNPSSAFRITQMPVRNTNQIELRFTNRTGERRYDLDFAATNILVESSHEPILLGKSNGVWWIVFR